MVNEILWSLAVHTGLRGESPDQRSTKGRIMSRIRFALLATAGLVAAGPCLAADMYGAPPAQPYGGYGSGSSGPNWNGLHLGAQIGHGWGSNGLDGTQLGVYAGVNTKIGSNVVAGVEGDHNVSGQTAQRLVGPNLYKYNSGWNASIRPRVGVAFDRVMPYATAGIAFADDSLKALGTSSAKTKIGYAVGAGLEAQVTDRISVKGELVRLGFGRTTHIVGAGVPAASSINSNVLRAGVAYRF